MHPSHAPRPARRRVALAAVALLAPALAGCGFDAQTNKVYQPAVGANVRTGTVDVLGAVVVSSEPGKGMFIATLVNQGAGTDSLDSITGDGGVKVAAGATPKLPNQTPVNLADEANGKGFAVTGETVSTVDSAYVQVTLTFADSDPVTVNAPVVPATGPYAGLAAPATPSAPNSVAAQGATDAVGG